MDHCHRYSNASPKGTAFLFFVLAAVRRRQSIETKPIKEYEITVPLNDTVE
jgi:hypothetical protein